MVSLKTKNAYLKSIGLITFIGFFLNITKLPDFSNYSFLPNIEPTFFKLDFAGLFTAKAGFVAVIMTLFTLIISDLFDTVGTFVGTGKKAGIFKVDEDGNMSSNLEKVLICDSTATIIGSLLGTSNVSTYVESSVGIEMGGRTGLIAVSALYVWGYLCFWHQLLLVFLFQQFPLC